jgi:hypothetical protein
VGIQIFSMRSSTLLFGLPSFSTVSISVLNEGNWLGDGEVKTFIVG